MSRCSTTHCRKMCINLSQRCNTIYLYPQDKAEGLKQWLNKLIKRNKKAHISACINLNRGCLAISRQKYMFILRMWVMFESKVTTSSAHMETQRRHGSFTGDTLYTSASDREVASAYWIKGTRQGGKLFKRCLWLMSGIEIWIWMITFSSALYR